MIREVSLTSLGAAALVGSLAAQMPALSFDASIGVTSGAQRAALSVWHPLLRLGGRFDVGVGARVSAYTGDAISYANKDRVQGGLAASVTIDPAVYALNGAVFAEVNVAGPVGVGANLDLVGLATGPTRVSGSLTEQPQAESSFQFGPGDHGALNSEFFLAVQITSLVRMRAGSSHYVTNYIVTDNAAPGLPSSRYQKFRTVPFVALALQF